MIRVMSLAILAVALAAPSARAQTTSGNAPVNDSLFAEAAVLGGLSEVQLAQIGAQKATDSELKKLSKEMIDDHNKLNQELVNLAAQKRIAIPRTLDARAQFCAQNLMGVSSEHFDRCYAKAQLHAHTEAIATYEAEAERGQDPDVKAFAARALPSIKKHLHAIKPIAMKHDKDHDKDKDKDHSRRSDRAEK